jgi:hypothetical protein
LRVWPRTRRSSIRYGSASFYA